MFSVAVIGFFGLGDLCALVRCQVAFPGGILDLELDRVVVIGKAYTVKGEVVGGVFLA